MFDCHKQGGTGAAIATECENPSSVYQEHFCVSLANVEVVALVSVKKFYIVHRILS